MKTKQNSPQTRLGLTQQFIMLFTLGAILPVVLLGIFIMCRAYWRLTEKQNRILSASQVVTQSIMQRDLNAIELSAYQTADVVISDVLTEYYSNKKVDVLQSRLVRFAKHSRAKFIAVYDKQNKLILAYNLAQPVQKIPQVLEQQITPLLKDQTSKNNIKASVESLTLKSNQSELYYTVITPIHNQDDLDQTIGHFILAKSVNELLTIEDMKAALPGADISLFDMQKPPHAIYETNPNFKVSTMKPDELSDKVRYKTYKILNRLGVPVGEVIIHSPHIEFSNILETGISWVLASVILGLIVISWLGFYLHNCFVKPVTRIAEAANLVSRGDFNAEVELTWSTAEVKSLVDNFNKMTSSLKLAEESKQNNIAALTHDLRTPLLAESRVFELFEEADDFPNELRPLLHDLIDSNNHQLDMVNQLLTVYHYEAGEFPLRLSLTNLNILIQSILQHLQHLASKNNVQLVFHPSENNPRVSIDEKQIRRVLINILMNAIENIPPVGDMIELRTSFSNTTPQSLLEITITDNGPGIPPELQENWFDKYASHQLNKKIGSGLGLSICKKIIEQHNGTIIINNQVKLGTQFIIRIPVSIPTAVEAKIS